MADFVQTMKDWRRMCKVQEDTTCGACSSCPMGDDGKSCIAVYEDEFETVDFAHIEQTVTAWAADHQIVYPTWAEFLHEAFCEKYPMPYRGDTAWYAFLRETPIPSDIAQKLGIEPKEDI